MNSQTPIGYAINMAVQTGSIMFVGQTVVCALGLLLAFFGTMMAFGQSIQRKIHNIKAIYNEQVDKNDAQIRKQFCDAIRFHTNIKELSIDSIADFSSKF